jgi:hypothetical protein
MMSKAEHFMDRFTELDKALADAAVDTDTKTHGDVEYTTHTFEDGSKFTQGSNGYIGAETPACPEKVTPISFGEPYAITSGYAKCAGQPVFKVDANPPA